jgi:hypothetical protein
VHANYHLLRKVSRCEAEAHPPINPPSPACTIKCIHVHFLHVILLLLRAMYYVTIPVGGIREPYGPFTLSSFSLSQYFLPAMFGAVVSDGLVHAPRQGHGAVRFWLYRSCDRGNLGFGWWTCAKADEQTRQNSARRRPRLSLHGIPVRVRTGLWLRLRSVL